VRVINLFGGPGAGKSTTAAGLFWLMKNAGLRVELVTEYAKALAWAKRGEELTDQFYIYAKQHHRQFVLRDQVDYCITDSPLLLTLLYTGDIEPPSYKQFVIDTFNSYTNINFFVNRVKPYVELGRFQNEWEADAIGRRTEALLNELNIVREYVDGDETSCHQIVAYLKRRGLSQ
jgi:hypothetical protein